MSLGLGKGQSPPPKRKKKNNKKKKENKITDPPWRREGVTAASGQTAFGQNWCMCFASFGQMCAWV